MINWSQIGDSFGGLKSWIKIWIFVLILVNGYSFFQLSTPTGQWTAAAAAFIGVSNALLIFKYSGLTRILAFPHLVWIPLIAMILYRFVVADQQTPIGLAEFWFAVVVVVINAISLVFDINDCVQWAKGKREILGLE